MRRLFDIVHSLCSQKPQQPSMLIVGLGNPGGRYAQTRHNVGFWCVDHIAKEHSVNFSRRRVVLAGDGLIGGHPVVLAKPRTFVNHSGKAVTYLLARYRASPQDLLVIYDDMDLPLGKVRLRAKGGAGGHNGINSIIEMTGTQDFPRLRIGIGRPVDGTDRIGYVLGTMSEVERKLVDEAVERAAWAVDSTLADGIDFAMERFN